MAKKLFAVAILLLLILPVIAQDATEAPEGNALPAAAELESGWNTLIPGGETICGRGTEFKFFVRPAETPENIMIYFQGGGACWNDFTCSPGGTFDDSIGTAEEEIGRYGGIFDYTSEENPVSDYTAVFIPYCTADVHIGDAVVDYAGGNVTIHHNGFNNASAVLDWVYENYESPEAILVTGSSAGAYGAIHHAPYIIEHYPDTKIVQFGDAGVGVTPEGWPVLEQWGMFNNVPTVIADTEPAEYSINNLYTASAEAYPEVTFSEFTTAADSVQVQFYGFMGAKAPWAEGMKANLEAAQEYDNFRSFVAGGSEHTILALPAFYTYAVDGVLFRDWFADLLAGNPVENLTCQDCAEPEVIEAD